MTQANSHQKRLDQARKSVTHWLMRFPRIFSIVRMARLFASPEARTVRRLQRREGENLLQPFSTTKMDRHPALFAFAKQRLAGRGDLQILSFGCSTGEEPLSLRHYFPDAVIDAIDINSRSIKIARRKAARQKESKINFRVGGQPPTIAEQYDAIFCLSVLRHGQLDADRPTTSSDIFPFSKFDATVVGLDATLRAGGLLLMWGSNFHFSDSTVANRYRPLDIPGMGPHAGAFYGPDDELLERKKPQSFAFEKLR